MLIPVSQGGAWGRKKFTLEKKKKKRKQNKSTLHGAAMPFGTRHPKVQDDLIVLLRACAQGWLMPDCTPA
jgi:hypothetical protein